MSGHEHVSGIDRHWFFLFICLFIEQIYGGKRQNVNRNSARAQYPAIWDYH
jgi:hypothetical protein